MIYLILFDWKDPVTLIVECAVSSKLVEIEVNNQTCSNVLAHRGRLSIGRTRTAEAPVSIPGAQASHHSRSPWLKGVLYPDLVGGCSFR